ncbi:unnamed protein product, partial [Rotaria sp. Silwood2]
MGTIIKQKSIIIKCSNPSNTIESITCMAVESTAKHYPVSMIWVYSNLSKDDFMPSDQLQTTLSDTLNYFSILAGRATENTKGNVIMHLTNEGVLYTEAECPNNTLDYFIPRTSSDENFDYEHINTSDLAVTLKTGRTEPCVSIQVTHAQSMSHFVNTWASGKPPQAMPMFDKTFVLHSTERKNSLARPQDTQEQQRTICKIYFFSVDELKDLKQEASKDLSQDYISTYDALFPHMILVIAAATQTSLTSEIKILQSLNGRSRFVSC